MKRFNFMNSQASETSGKLDNTHAAWIFLFSESSHLSAFDKNLFLCHQKIFLVLSKPSVAWTAE